MAGPFDILKDLQERVTALEQQLGDTPGADNLQPNVLTVDADGTIGADFTGKISAEGLTLPAATTGPDPTNQAQWIDSLGRLVAAMWGSEFGGPQEELNLLLQEPDTGGEIARLWLTSANNPSFGFRLDSPSGWNPAASHQGVVAQLDPDGTITSDFLQKANDLSDVPNIATARANLALGSAAVASVTNFLQLATPGTWEIAGPYQVNFTNVGSGGTQTVTVTHNLNWSYTVAIGACSGNRSYPWGWSLANNNQMTFNARNLSSATDSFTLHAWIIGHP